MIKPPLLHSGSQVAAENLRANFINSRAKAKPRAPAQPGLNRRGMRIALEKMGHTPAQVRLILISMGYAEPKGKGGK